MVGESRQCFLGRVSRRRADVRVGPTIYMDYHASTPVDPAVAETMADANRTDFANPQSSDHVLGWRAHRRIEESAAAIGGFAGISSDYVLFLPGATEANRRAIVGAAAAAGRPRVLISKVEHRSVRVAAEEAARRFGLTLERLEVGADGRVQTEELSRRLGRDVGLVSVMAVNNEIGTINDIAALGALCRERGALFHVDASQAPLAVELASAMPVIDLLTLSSHKAYGPKGIGALLAAPDLQDAMSTASEGEAVRPPGTLPTTLCIGFAKALTLLDPTTRAEERLRVARLRDRFADGLVARGVNLDWVGPAKAARHPGNAALRFKGVDAADLLSSLQPALAASTQSACSSGVIEPSPVLLAIGLGGEAAGECVRFGLGRFSDEGQVDEAIALVVQAIGSMKERSNLIQC